MPIVRKWQLRKLVEFWQRGHGLVVDGIAGSQTLASIGPDIVGHSVGEPESFDPGIVIPTDRIEIRGLLGHPGPVRSPDKAWRKANIHSYRDLPGVARWMNLHILIEPMAREGIRRGFESTGYVITRGDSWVHRYLRHDPRRGLSLHAFGAAIDLNPHQNKARSFARGQAPEPWGKEWMTLWPDGIPRAYVEAMEAVGWTWGGVWGKRGGPFSERIKNVRRCDPMHFEARDR